MSAVFPRRALVAWCGMALQSAGVCVELSATPQTYREVVQSLKPGDVLALAPGVYHEGLRLHVLQGTAEQPITISGSAGPVPTVFAARPGHNTVSIVDASFLVVRNLTLDGRDLPVDAVKCEGHAHWAHHITLERLTIVRHAANQQIVGISTKCPAWNWVVRETVIDGAGTGMYFGDSDGSAPFVAGVIEYNLVQRTIGYNLQIKHQNARPWLPGLPTTPQRTVIRHNVFSKSTDSARGDLARPNVLVGHWPPRGAGARDLYAIYANFFYENPSEALFQGEGRLALYHNLMVNTYGDALRVQPHHDRPKDVQIMFNTVVASAAGLSVLQAEHGPRARLSVVGNAVFAERPFRGMSTWDNLIDRGRAAAALLRAPRLRPPHLDLHLRDATRRSFTLPPTFAALPDAMLDFDGLPREPGLPGAYGSPHLRAALPALELKPHP